MNNKKLLLAGTLTLAIIIAGAAALYSSFSKGGHSPTAAAPNAASDSSQGSAESEPQPAPDFTVLDRDGNQVRLSDLRGKPVVLSFGQAGAASAKPACRTLKRCTQTRARRSTS